MMPFIRSLAELMVITQTRDQLNIADSNEDSNKYTEEYLKIKNINSKKNKQIDLPVIPKIKRQKWKKRKEAVSRFFDELDYNNQIQSSYDLTLLESQNNHNKHDAA